MIGQNPQVNTGTTTGARPDVDEAWMQRALQLAERGRATVSPNPLVGCVVVADGEVVGEGWHARAGADHAEVLALRAAGERARGATAYVTLEPCDHQGRTPPCTQALRAAGIERVVAALADAHPQAGGGARTLRNAGIDVELGCLAIRAERQNEVFLHGLAQRRPFVVAKAATSLDGRTAAEDGSSQWLTGRDTRRRAHLLRAHVDAVVVGSGTYRADAPRLTVRLDGYEGPQPLRVVLDRRGALRPDESWLHHRGELSQLMAVLWERDVRSVLVEGGPTVLGAFARAGLVDKWVVHLAPLLLGERGLPLIAGPWAPRLDAAPRLRLETVERVGDDTVLTLYPRAA